MAMARESTIRSPPFFLVLQNVVDVFVFIGSVASCECKCLVRCHTSHKHTPTCENTIVSRKYAHPFATLALVQNTGEGCDDFSRDYTPLLVPVKHDLIVSGGWGQA